MKDDRLIYNAIRTPDGTVLESRFTHDYVTYIDKNGEEYMVDGGLSYLRRNKNKEPAEELSEYMYSGHEKARQRLAWGTYGKNGDQPLTWKLIKDMSDDHINNVLADVRSITPIIKDTLLEELVYRKNSNIRVQDNE